MNTKIGLALLATALALTVTDATAADFKPKQAGDFMVRARALGVLPSDGGEIESKATGASAGLVISDIDNSVVPELDFSYFLTDHIAAELILATTPHKVEATGNVDVGDAWLLPPTLTLQYHPLPAAQISPYIGAGINYTMFFGEGGGLPGFKVESSFGLALQAGVDYQLSGPWSLNLDVKKIYLRPEAETTTLHVDHVRIDPWLVGVGIGYRF